MNRDKIGKAMEAHAKELKESAEKERTTIYDILPSSKMGEVQRITSLEHWINLCNILHIKHITTELVGEISREDIFSIVDMENDVSQEGIKFFQNVKEMKEENFMFRWEFCAGQDIKHNLGTGKPKWSEEFIDVDLQDMRFIDIMFSTQRNSAKLWKRPWLNGIIHENYPVEFRVFARDGIILGCSSYYPQRDLPEEFRKYADEAMEISKGFLKFEDNFSADFMVSEEYWHKSEKTPAVVFIEGGPPFGEGSDPCCFDPSKEISGIALTCEWQQRRRGLNLP